MSLKETLRGGLERATGLRVMRQPPFGMDPFADLQLVFPRYPVRTVLDIGANEGQSVAMFRKAWPEAVIHCLEPVQATFDGLRARAEGPKVKCHRIAIGAADGELTMYKAAGGQRTDISSPSAGHPALEGQELVQEQVPVHTLQRFFQDHGLNTADFVKVDTEGHDMAVIDGAEALFREGRIGVLQVEVGMNPGNRFHVPLHRMTERLAGLGHQLFGLYGQMHEWPTRQPILRRCDALYIPERMAAPGTWSV